ncbi:1-acyl-sn-glycerol-3-phosphate acyltransferase [Zooshikella harenae]|uniref:1-acyl-sn-glycerol-3-phosphate acyltransferase n=1 Tax=Zooshikella harenae TaxID=2827238 RepID=A0ABS5ZCB2_9GAMM|nr:1-acyl-sn-glycerol-3-phosphate acyltransferase [Zooshikella harenae]MBU2710956.1 1-acyl-sn-glycerol-3-phosphate acyltransferase [Zooshikella harenae]
MDNFDDIRPYHDDEVRMVLDRLLDDGAFINAMTSLKFPKCPEFLQPGLKYLVRIALREELRHVKDVAGLQDVLETYIDRNIQKNTSQVTYSGQESLKNARGYLFMCNHRDIVMDPTFVNFALYHHGMKTPRIAIGDNLLSRPYVSDLMRLNKSFVVKRSVKGRREKLAVYKQLSAYINHSLSSFESIWIAQREGRSKDSNDKTDTAILKMLLMAQTDKDATFAEQIQRLSIVPVAVSYEYDPCDIVKARELAYRAAHGKYDKAENEDVNSIVRGITGYKGHVHISFGQCLEEEYSNATEVANEIDRQIHSLYHLHPSNFLAFEQVKEAFADITPPTLEAYFPDLDLKAKREEFEQRLASCPETWRHWWLQAYANPLINKFRCQMSSYESDDS